jgi:hypothetical protein
MAADIGTLTPEQMLQQQQILRQQKMAEMLMQQPAPQGQMIGNRYVAPSFTQNLANLANMYVGQRAIEKGDQAQIDLAKAIREQKMGVLENINQALDAGDLKKARGIATANPEYAGQFAAPLIANAIPKQQESKVVGNTLVGPDGKVIYTAPKEFAPHPVQMIDTQNGMVQFDPNTRSVTPVMINGQQIMGNKGNLPEAATKQVTGATNLKDAITNYKDTLQGFNTLDMASPDARAKMGNAYNNMMLQAKEAYNLGVLNGPDYAILQSVVKDPTKLSALLTSKEALQGQATDLSKQADRIIENVYKTHNRTVPANLLTPTPPAPSAKKGGIPVGITPAEWNAMSPADKKLFE